MLSLSAWDGYILWTTYIVINFTELFRFCRIFLNFHVFCAFLRHANNFRRCYALILLCKHPWNSDQWTSRSPMFYEQVGPCLLGSPKRWGDPYVASEMGAGGSPYLFGTRIPLSRGPHIALIHRISGNSYLVAIITTDLSRVKICWKSQLAQFLYEAKPRYIICRIAIIIYGSSYH